MMRDTVYVLALLSLLTVAAVATHAGSRNLGPSADEVVTLFNAQGIPDSSPVTSTSYYHVGRDTEITVDARVQGLTSGETVTLTALWELPGGNAIGYALPRPTADTIVITGGSGEAGALWELDPLRGPERLWITAETSDATLGCTLTAQVIGR